MESRRASLKIENDEDETQLLQKPIEFHSLRMTHQKVGFSFDRRRTKSASFGRDRFIVASSWAYRRSLGGGKRGGGTNKGKGGKKLHRVDTTFPKICRNEVASTSVLGMCKVRLTVVGSKICLNSKKQRTTLTTVLLLYTYGVLYGEKCMEYGVARSSRYTVVHLCTGVRIQTVLTSNMAL